MIIWLDVLMHDWTSAQVPAMVITIYLASQVGSRQEANFLHCYKLHQQSRGIRKKLPTVKHAGLDITRHMQPDWFATAFTGCYTVPW